MSPVDERMFTIDAFEEDLQDLELTSGGSRTPRSSSERKEHDGKTPMAVFPDMQDMMQQVRNDIVSKPTYSVFDFYHETGLFQKIAKAQSFESLTLLVISLNSVWIALDTDMNHSDLLIEAHPVFQVGEHFFCLYFTLEWFIRFRSFRVKKNCMRDAWFVFDSVLVFMMVLETWIMTMVMLVFGGAGGGGLGNASLLRMARLMRLSRMARMARLLRSMPELMILIKGMVAAMRSVLFTLCLLLVLLYVFGIAFRQLSEDTSIGDTYFDSVPSSMYTLLVDGIFMDSLGVVVRDIGEDSIPCAVLFWLFVLVSTLTVMNMLIGVLCEVVSAVAATEKEALTVTFVNNRMKEIVNSIDKNQNHRISKDEFVEIINDPKARNVLEEVGVDAVGLVDSASSIFKDYERDEKTKELSFPDFMEAVLQMRGTNSARVKDIVDLRRLVRSESDRITMQVRHFEERMIAATRHMNRKPRYRRKNFSESSSTTAGEPGEQFHENRSSKTTPPELAAYFDNDNRHRSIESDMVGEQSRSPARVDLRGTTDLQSLTLHLDMVMHARQDELQRTVEEVTTALREGINKDLKSSPCMIDMTNWNPSSLDADSGHEHGNCVGEVSPSGGPTVLATAPDQGPAQATNLSADRGLRDAKTPASTLGNMDFDAMRAQLTCLLEVTTRLSELERTSQRLMPTLLGPAVNSSPRQSRYSCFQSQVLS